ncbi:LCP family protein [Streptomyces sp. TRM76323]|uniref:LCP family protein n=1 Tax=Streptomyces tamarix TaxID=3078565 RepID=A0ABU3QJP4_9ACTN|nr:LCP family protein [Streptomyces tamarix]MDT9682990.1 LCP family protein [Streptomyces tamarix]
MNDQNSHYDPYYPPQPQIVGYDEYGQPVYQQAQQPPQPEQQNYAYGYDPYAQATQPYPEPQPYPQDQQYQGYPGYEEQGQPGHGGYDPYGTPQWQVPQAPQAPQAPQVPAVQPPQPAPPVPGQVAAPAGVPEQRRPAPEPQDFTTPEPPAENPPGGGPRTDGDVRGPHGRRDSREQGSAGDGGDYRTEQFAFVDEPDEESEDAIDWLKFTESRSERREEAKRRGRNRVVALCVALALALVGGVGYLWYEGMLPGLSEKGAQQGGTTATGPQKRDVIVLHLHNTKDEATSTALLVDNATTKQGTTVLLPNALAVANDDGTTTTLGKSVEDDGSSGTREAIGSLLGTRITGTWRLDTPYLENLVELVGGVDLTTDTEVPAAKEGGTPVVRKGENQTLDGRMAVAYATYRGPGESETAQLQRFGQIVHGVLRKMSDDPESATMTIQSLAQILDPSLPDKDLGASLAKLAERAKTGAYKTELLPVQGDGRLTEEATRGVVEDVLGGSVSAPEPGSVVRVGVRNASGDGDAAEAARIVLVNGGYAVIDGGAADGTESTSEVLYGDAAQKAKADEVAKTLGLPARAVRKGEAPANADVTVVLGKDYEAK